MNAPVPLSVEEFLNDEIAKETMKISSVHHSLSRKPKNAKNTQTKSQSTRVF
jgi:hypothetical protein